MIVALYKIWRGHEFMAESLESIYYHVGAVVVVSSEIGWNGKSGNTTRDIVEKWKKNNDYQDKIKIVPFNSVSQRDQYLKGIEVINKEYKNCQWIMLIDSDEVWDDENLSKANNILKYRSKVNGYKCKCIGYIKHPVYVIDDAGYGVSPMVFIKPNCEFKGVRGGDISPSIIMNNVFMHHLTAVRDNDEEVFTKFETSTIGDLTASLVDMEKWKKDVWEKIPNVSNFHYNKGWEFVWRGINVIRIDQLPDILKNHPLTLRYINECKSGKNK